MSPELRIKVLKAGPSGGWAAFRDDEGEVVAYGTTYDEAVEKAEKMGVTEPVLVKIPNDWAPTVF